MERKECNAEGKTSACQITSFISAMFYFVDLTPLGIFFSLL
jgi:hypothetical protein